MFEKEGGVRGRGGREGEDLESRRELSVVRVLPDDDSELSIGLGPSLEEGKRKVRWRKDQLEFSKEQETGDEDDEPARQRPKSKASTSREEA